MLNEIHHVQIDSENFSKFFSFLIKTKVDEKMTCSQFSKSKLPLVLILVLESIGSWYDEVSNVSTLPKAEVKPEMGFSDEFYPSL